MRLRRLRTKIWKTKKCPQNADTLKQFTVVRRSFKPLFLSSPDGGLTVGSSYSHRLKTGASNSPVPCASAWGRRRWRKAWSCRSRPCRQVPGQSAPHPPCRGPDTPDLKPGSRPLVEERVRFGECGRSHHGTGGCEGPAVSAEEPDGGIRPPRDGGMRWAISRRKKA